jgi:hypothetical protein
MTYERIAWRFLVVLAIACTALFSCKQAGEPEKRITSDTDGMLIIDGKRTFIIGSYYKYPGDKAFEEMAGDGYNYLRVGKDRAELNKAWAQGLYSWISIGSLDPDNREESSTRLSATVNEFKDHSGLLCWETQDEPAFTWNSGELRVPPEPLIATYELIKQEDPDHMVYMNHGPVNLVSTLQLYNPANDIVACDVYPVIPDGIRVSYALYPDGRQGDLLNTYISQVGEYTDKMKEVGGVSRPLFMVLQGFSWEMLRREDDRDPAMVLYPSHPESRFMAYNAIIHGANGIVYWGTYFTPPEAPFWDDLKSTTRELGEMQEVLSAPSLDQEIGIKYHELGYSVDAGVEILVKAFQGDVYLITANADRYPAKASLDGLNDFKQARVLTEDREIDILDGEITDRYEAFEVHIYHLTKNASIP